jgi:tetratricopeptide (TPR) repeat protein
MGMKKLNLFLLTILIYSLIWSTPIFPQNKRVAGIFNFDNESSAKYDWVSRGIEEILYDKLNMIYSISLYERETLTRVTKKLEINSSKDISARQAFTIGKETGIEVIYLGNYRVTNDNISIGFRLISTYTGTALMEEVLIGNLSEIFDLIENVVVNSMSTLQINLSPEERQRLVNKPTDSITAFEYYCKAYTELGHGSTMETIADYFQRAIREDPNFWEARYNLGVIYYNFDLFDKALLQFETVIQRRPEFYKPYYGRAVIYYLKRDFPSSIKEFETILKLKPDHDRSYYYLGIIYTRMDSLTKGSKYLDKSIEINPNYAPAYYQQAVTETKKGWNRKAIAAAKNALKLNPNYFPANNALGEAYYSLGLYEEAIIEFEKTINLKPIYSTAYFNLGNAVYKKGALAEIVDAYWSLIERQYLVQAKSNENPQEESPLDDLQSLRDESRSEDSKEIFIKMVSAYSNALKYDNDFYEASYNLALTYENYNKPDSAEYYYLKTLAIKPDLVQAQMKLGKNYELQGKYDLALAKFKEVVKYEPDYFAESPTLGEEYRNINVVEEVLQEYLDRLNRDPNNPESLRVVGKIFLSLGRLGQAEQYYEQLLQLKPNDKEAKQTLHQIRRKMSKI